MSSFTMWVILFAVYCDANTQISKLSRLLLEHSWKNLLPDTFIPFWHLEYKDYSFINMAYSQGSHSKIHFQVLLLSYQIEIDLTFLADSKHSYNAQDPAMLRQSRKNFKNADCDQSNDWDLWWFFFFFFKCKIWWFLYYFFSVKTISLIWQLYHNEIYLLSYNIIELSK